MCTCVTPELCEVWKTPELREYRSYIYLRKSNMANWFLRKHMEGMGKSSNQSWKPQATFRLLDGTRQKIWMFQASSLKKKNITHFESPNPSFPTANFLHSVHLRKGRFEAVAKGVTQIHCPETLNFFGSPAPHQHRMTFFQWFSCVVPFMAHHGPMYFILFHHISPLLPMFFLLMMFDLQNKMAVISQLFSCFSLCKFRSSNPFDEFPWVPDWVGQFPGKLWPNLGLKKLKTFFNTR